MVGQKLFDSPFRVAAALMMSFLHDISVYLQLV